MKNQITQAIYNTYSAYSLEDRPEGFVICHPNYFDTEYYIEVQDSFNKDNARVTVFTSKERLYCGSNLANSIAEFEHVVIETIAEAFYNSTEFTNL